jgi:phage regulator Rha-like protein
MSIIDTFNRMKAEEMEKVAAQNAVAPENAELDAQMEILEKYASWAEQTLIENVGEGQYTAEDVEKLATAKIEADAEESLMREKVAEAYELGQIMYEGFKAAAAADAKA